MSEFETISFVQSGGVATVTLNRPQKLNALNDQMVKELAVVFKQAARDDSVRCLVLTGNGRAFSAGQDLAAFQARQADESILEHLRHGYNKLIMQMVTLPKPLIGAINGVAAGAGCGVALATDLRLAADSASFMLAFSRIGLAPDSGVSWLLPRLIGTARSYEMAVTGDPVDAATAHAWGMVNHVVPQAQLAETAAAWAERLAAGPTVAYGLTKRTLHQAWESDLPAALEYEAYMQELAGRTADHQEGVQAFLEKRTAVFQGK